MSWFGEHQENLKFYITPDPDRRKKHFPYKMGILVEKVKFDFYFILKHIFVRTD